jgi:hypothetical protein
MDFFNIRKTARQNLGGGAKTFVKKILSAVPFLKIKKFVCGASTITTPAVGPPPPQATRYVPSLHLVETVRFVFATWRHGTFRLCI